MVIDFLTGRGWQDDEVVEAIVKQTQIERSLVKQVVTAAMELTLDPGPWTQDWADG